MRRIVDLNVPFAYAQQGFLLTVRDAALMAQPFDLGRLAIAGQPVRVADDVAAPEVIGHVLTASPAGPIVSAREQLRQANVSSCGTIAWARKSRGSVQRHRQRRNRPSRAMAAPWRSAVRWTAIEISGCLISVAAF